MKVLSVINDHQYFNILCNKLPLQLCKEGTLLKIDV